MGPVLVVGGTGNVGRELLPLLVRRGLDVRCLVRAATAPPTLDAPGVQAVQGDLDDPTTFAPALDGCERLFLLTPPHPDQVAREVALVDAAASAGVRHVVAVSVIGADREAPSNFSRWHADIDAHLVGSGLGHSILRPAAFMQVHLLPPTARGEGRWYGMSGDGVHAFVDVLDVAEAAASVLAAPAPEDGVHELTGPAAISMPQAARAYGRALGRDVEYVDLPPEQFAGALAAAGLPDHVVEGIVALYTSIRAGHAATTTDQVERLTGRPPHSYDDLLERLDQP